MGTSSSTCKGDEKRYNQRFDNLNNVITYFEEASYQYPFQIKLPNLIPELSENSKIELSNLNPIPIDELNNFKYFFESNENTSEFISEKQSMGEMTDIGIDTEPAKYYKGEINKTPISTFIVPSFDSGDEVVDLCIYKLLLRCKEYITTFPKYIEYPYFRSYEHFEEIKKILNENNLYQSIVNLKGKKKEILLQTTILRIINRPNEPDKSSLNKKYLGLIIEKTSQFLLCERIVKYIKSLSISIGSLEFGNRSDIDNVGYYYSSELFLKKKSPNFQLLYATFVVPVKLEENTKKIIIDKFWKNRRLYYPEESYEIVYEFITEYLKKNLSSCNLYQIQVVEPEDNSALIKIDEGLVDYNLLPYLTKSILGQFIFAIYALHQVNISHNSIDWDHMNLSSVPSAPCYYYEFVEHGKSISYYRLQSYGVELTIVDFRDSTKLPIPIVGLQRMESLDNDDILMFVYYILQFIENNYKFEDNKKSLFGEYLSGEYLSGGYLSGESQKVEDSTKAILSQLLGGEKLYNEIKNKINEKDENFKVRNFIKTKYAKYPKISLLKYFNRVAERIDKKEIPKNSNIYTLNG